MFHGHQDRKFEITFDTLNSMKGRVARFVDLASSVEGHIPAHDSFWRIPNCTCFLTVFHSDEVGRPPVHVSIATVHFGMFQKLSYAGVSYDPPRLT